MISVLLGPQRPHSTVADAVHSLTEAGETVAVISAGWQEAEGDIEELGELIDRPLVDLALYARADSVMHADVDLSEAHHQRQKRLRSLQRLYRLRLAHLMDAAVDVLDYEDDLEILKLEQRHAITQLQALDRHHLQRIRAAHNDYESVRVSGPRAVLDDEKEALREQLDKVTCVVITGGNVAVLASRLRLLEMDNLLAQKNLVAWSAGAMVLCDRVVLYHDYAPQGQRDPEILDFGLGLAPGLVALPGAKRRLNETLTTRLSLISRRFAPRRCITLNNDSIVRVRDGSIESASQSRSVSRTGVLQKLRTK